MKKILSFLLSVCLLISIVPISTVPVSAAETQSDGVITVGTAYGKPGTSVSVDLEIKNNPGILGMTLKLEYDESKATLVSVENGDALSHMTFTTPKDLKSGCQLPWDAENVTDEDITDGVIATLTFEILDTTQENEDISIRLSYDTGAIIDGDMNPLPISLENGVIQVISYTPGDVNEDGLINTTDVVYLRRFVAGGYGIIINESAADVNDDGLINTTDAVYIRRYVAGGYGIKLKPSTPKCSHTMETIAYKAATCTEDGNISYYHCTTCDKYYNDINGTAEIALTNTVLAAIGHTAVTDSQVEPTYTSVGWTEGSHCAVCGKVLVAQEEIPMLEKDEYYITYNITYNDSYLQAIDIANPNPSVYTKQDGLKLAEPEVNGYIFEGWYDGQGSSASKITEIAVGTIGNITLYAHWSKVEYTVTFNSPLAETSSKTYTVDTGATLTNPSYYGYSFVGWSDAYGNLVADIPAGTTGNITLTANWTSKRNQTVPVTSLDDPLIVEDEENGMLFFTYYIGRMENVPLYTIKDFGYNSGGGITWSETVEYTYSISEENATSVANTVAEATTTTSSWTLSQGWNSLTSISETQSSSTTSEQMAAYSQSFEQTGAYSIGSSVGGSKSTTTEAGISSKVSATASEKTNVSANLGVEDAGIKAGVSAGVEVGYSVTGEVGGNYTETEENSKNWSSTSSFEASKSASSDFSVSSSLSSTISEEYSYGKSYGSSEEFEESNELAVSSSKETEYGSTLVYATDTSTSVTKTYTNEGSTDGYYRLVAAGTIHVFAVVGYDIASNSYFVYTYNVMDDETYEFMDYSATTQGYDDLQNGILAFEVPYEVNTYVDSLTLTTSGLVVDIETSTITDYNGTAEHVMIPEYITVDNGDGTVSVIHIAGIEPDAFAGNTSIVEVKFPDTITEIPDGAFKGCTSLTGVIAKNITSVGAEAFSGCTSLSNYTVSAQVTKLGKNAFVDVPNIIVTAYNADIAKVAVVSGAKSITLNLSSLVDTLSDYTFTIPDGTRYFAFNGGTHYYSGVSIVSDAEETVINGATFTNCVDIPLVISSENVTLNRVTVESSGLALQLTAETANVALFGSVNMNSSSSNAVRSNNIVLSLSNSGVSSKMYVTGNVLVCGAVTNEKYLSVTNGEIICYSVDDACVVTFDANGGTCAESTRVVSCGTAIGELPMATCDGYVFYGWIDESGNILESNTVLYTAGEMTLYAQWIEPFTISWNPGTGYTISVTRNASPTGNAATGTLNSGDTIYPNDVLSISYTASTGYTLSSTGETEITVTGDVTSAEIYATATANSYTYNIVYVSSNGTALGTSTATYKYGTTNTISAPAKSGYNTPSSQSVTWDSTVTKTITFKYTPTSISTQTIKTGTWVSWGSGKHGITYNVKVEFGERTSTGVKMRVVWTNTVFTSSYLYYGYAQNYSATIGGKSTGTVQIAAASAFNSATYNGASATGTSGWITVPVSATDTSTTISLSWVDGDGISGSWSGTVTVPTY